MAVTGNGPIEISKIRIKSDLTSRVSGNLTPTLAPGYEVFSAFYLRIVQYIQ
jgi:hypothetical protein